jgi:hypothetical protein
MKIVITKCEESGNKPQEPDFIASLTVDFTEKFFQALKSYFPNNKFSVTGIYSHQKPTVDIGLKMAPEIGDWLLVYIYTNKKGVKKCNSLLLQAKMAGKKTINVPTSEKHQLMLYTHWPKFRYKRAGLLNGIQRDIQPKAINDGAKYLLIEKKPVIDSTNIQGNHPMRCAIPATTLTPDCDLATVIVDFLKFKVGRNFKKNTMACKDDWSKMIWDLIGITYDKATRRMNVGLSDFQRQITAEYDGYCFFHTETDSIFGELHRLLSNSNEERTDEKYIDNENFAPSILLIECVENKIESVFL